MKKNAIYQLSIGGFIILFFILVALFANFLRTDKSLDANTIYSELSMLKPFSKIYFLEKNGKTNPIKVLKKSENHISFRYFGKDTTTYKENINYISLSTHHFYFGTDRFGRDVFSRLILGSRQSILVGFFSVIIALIIGISIGLLSGYFGKWIDYLGMFSIQVAWSIPTLLLALAITLALGKGFWQVFLAIGLSTWVDLARIVRAKTMEIKSLNYIKAAQILNYSKVRIILKHILPNILSPILVMSTSIFASAILLEAGLSFLGLGIQPPTPSWGQAIKSHYYYIIYANPYPAMLPGLAIMLLVSGFNIFTSGLRDYFQA